ncbi:protoporphyrinogen/coproporphyrinogen oxidase [Miltoncostaea marina]|uniref:protoporphyrinogen/coproporphyrinogen oxidase n=1 Tax=Miltoncostaea marina TaxID=2843215 RepID=UPI001C3CEEA4|nr:FAD-dependent oxidoreductase [Miltoncostaea marina]
MATFDAVVLGAGPAGLGAGLALARAGARPLVVDPADEVGGLCVTRRRDGFAYDVGGHIPFVRDPARRAWLESLLGDELVWVGRPVSCVIDGAIRRGRYLDQRPGGGGDGRVWHGAAGEGTARGELAARFGGPFVDRVMRPYLEKVDGVPLERIPAERARRLLEDQAAPDGFVFPARGIGQLMDAMAGAAVAAGAEVRLGTRVTRIEVPDGALAAVALAGPRGEEVVEVRQAVVAMPAAAAARMLTPAPPGATTRGVRMRAVCIVYLALDRERLTDEPWIQVDHPAVPFARMFEPRNWSDALAPPGRTILGLECYCQAEAGDPVWSLGDTELGRLCAAALADPLGLLDDPAAARPVEVLRVARAYPMADAGQMAAVRAPAEWLADLNGVHLAPGAAVIEAVEGGERAAAAILAGIRGPEVPEDPATTLP